jgi:tetratricopeptide (TPR) repeat protein
MLFERARALEMKGDDAAAELAYRAVIAVDAMHFRAHNDLGLLYNRHGLAADALQCFVAAVAADDDNATGHANLGAMLLAAGEVATAKTHFEVALAQRPDHPGARNGLRAAHEQLGLPAPLELVVAPAGGVTGTQAPTAADPFVEYVFEIAANAVVARQSDAARTFLDAIVGSDARFVPLLRRVADAAGSQRDYALARTLFERALALEPRNADLHIGRAIVLEEMGEREAAQAAWSHELVTGAIRTLPYTGAGEPVRLLTIASALHAIRYEIFCDPNALHTTVLYTQAYRPGQALPPHDVVLLAVADVESDGPALDVASAILQRTDAPVINRPDRVRQTGRIEQASRLAAIDGVTTAQTTLFARGDLTGADAAARLAARGCTFPLLLRSPGFHNGRFFEHVADAAALAPAAAAMPGDAILAIAYQETRSADGMVRKYRVMTIDGRLYPVHLAISPHWKVHYVSSAMAFDARFRDEEAAYLTDMRAALGAPAVAALERIAAVTALDYGGIDFGLLPDGRVAVFEANGAMAIFLPDADPRWDYRRAAMTAAIQAATRMIVERGTHIRAP